ncbi:MAG: thioredoxin [Christensenella sp.]|nr:MAG: thioredoxin [Christensenella sp.]
MELILNNNNFDETIKNGVVLVDFWATWCGPCKMLAPNVEEIAKEYEGRAVVGKVDVDENPDLAERFGIMSIPALFVFVNGEVKEKLIGYRLKMQIAEVLDKYC